MTLVSTAPDQPRRTATRPRARARPALTLTAALVTAACGRTPALQPVEVPGPVPGACVPGNRDTSHGCPDGGPDSAELWVKDRRAAAPASLDAFYRVTANRAAVGARAVAYVDAGATVDPTALAAAVAALDRCYDALAETYGQGSLADVQDTGRVVVLAHDIRDDYQPDTGSFVGGYMAPRDLFPDALTSALYAAPERLTELGPVASIETATALRGHSNENQVVYLDLHPLLDGAAYGGDAARGQAMFVETAVHEAFHLFVYNRRVRVASVPNHLPWIAEGLAEQAGPLLAGLTAGRHERMQEYALPLVQGLLADGPTLLDLDASGNPLVGQLQAHLFFAYLWHRTGTSAGANDLFRRIVDAPDPTVGGVGAALRATGMGFDDVFADWAATNLVEGLGGRVAALSETSGPVDLGDGAYPSRGFDFSYAGTGIGSDGAPFAPGAVPFGDGGRAQLAPASYVVHSYTPPADETWIPLNQGMDDGLGVTLARPAGGDAWKLQRFDNRSSIALAGGQSYDVVVFNPRTSGATLSTGQLPWDARNLAVWAGGGADGWQRGAGAATGTGDAFFYRTTGVAVSRGGDREWIYVADALDHGVSRWELNTGAFGGRMGSAGLDCALDDASADGFRVDAGKLAAGHCRRSFYGPHGVAVDAAGNIYVADTDNHRVVARDRDGRFVAWLGNALDDRWQTLELGAAGDPPELGYDMSAAALNSPWGLAIDESSPSTDEHYLYVSCYGSSVVVRRRLHTGEYAGFVGNGVEGWDTATTELLGARGAGRAFFTYPAGLTLADGYLYVADSGNHRVSRWAIDGHDTGAGLGGARDGWHGAATPPAVAQDSRSFAYPADVAAAGPYLYVADRRDQRVARWSRDTGAFAGFIGGGVMSWSLADAGPTRTPLANAYAYPSTFMLEPQGVAVAPGDGAHHAYLLVTTVYNARVTRWNLDCLAHDDPGSCSF